MYMYFSLLLSLQDNSIREIPDSDLEELYEVVPLFGPSSSDTASEEEKKQRPEVTMKVGSFYGKKQQKEERK